MFYIPDLKYEEGKKCLEEMPGATGDAIRHYVAELEKHHKKTQETLDEAMEVFKGIKKFTRNI